MAVQSSSVNMERLKNGNVVELTKKIEALAKKIVFLKKQVVLKFLVIPDSSAVIEKSRPSRRKLGMQNLLLV